MRTLDPRAGERYPYIRRWAQYLGSYEYYALMQQERAHATKAPVDAVYEVHGIGGMETGKWVTLAEITNRDALHFLKTGQRLAPHEAGMEA